MRRDRKLAQAERYRRRVRFLMDWHPMFVFKPRVVLSATGVRHWVWLEVIHRRAGAVNGYGKGSHWEYKL